MHSELHTKNWQRIVIWVITITMVVGTLGFYVMLVLQTNGNQPTPQEQLQSNQPEQEAPVDPVAFKVDGDVTELQKIDLKVGDGAEVKPGDTVRAHYKGTIAQSGVKFDSSYDRGEPLVISLSQVIQGWQQGVPGMKIGGKRRLIIPSELAYGAQGSGAVVGPNADLVFEIEVLAINPAE